MAVSKNTLFIHGSADSVGSVVNSVQNALDPTVQTPALDCTNRCAAVQSVAGTSSFCDESCSAGWSLSSIGPRFDGHGCGVGDASKFGSSCRLCYTDQQGALKADSDLQTSGPTSVSSAVHVVMCDTHAPPAALECSSECGDSGNTVRFARLTCRIGQVSRYSSLPYGLNVPKRDPSANDYSCFVWHLSTVRTVEVAHRNMHASMRTLVDKRVCSSTQLLIILVSYICWAIRHRAGCLAVNSQDFSKV